ncbi:MAG: polysaccharide biosynthesis C-terminal domain-containing protein [Bacteroidetes bacterium]|nr:polysaccharide biosynthesis C-terminal domain-containing protein [Bacteroidota bacterium]
MSIRKQSIISSILVYIGFFIGLINTYFYVKNGSFTQEQFGLTKIFFDFGQNMYAFASLGVIPIIYKFYPYYKDNIEDKKNDLLTWAMVASLIGFIVVLIVGWHFEPLIVRKYNRTSPLIVYYYRWLFPFAMGMLFFSVIEGFCWAIQKTIASNFLKETVMRCITTIFILLFYFKVIDFNTFIHLFAFLYIIIFFILLFYLKSINQLHFSFTVSRVTKKFKKKMFGMQILIFSGTVIVSVAATIDSFVIAGFQSLAAVGVFTLAQYVANLIQVPQRSIQPVATGVLSRAWKDKNMAEIFRIYQRSSINLLILSLFIFGNVWLNIKQGMQLVSVQTNYEAGLNTLLVLAFARIIDAGTGLNSFVINTSTRWRFDFVSGIILLAFRLPLTWFLIKHYGIIGSAFADLFAVSIYNFIRYEFLRRTFKMQPFNAKTLYTLLLAFGAYFICFFLLNNVSGWIGIFARSILFSALIIGGTFYLKLTPDALQLLDNFKKRFAIRK